MTSTQSDGAGLRPRVSVVIPSHNRPELLRRAVRSALAQVDVDVELVVVDDGSDDAEAVARVCDRPGVVLRRHPQAQGVAAARNTGLRTATARWVAFLDDDDVWEPGKLAGQVAALQAAPGSRWALSLAVSVDEDLEPRWLQKAPPPGDQHAVLLHRNVVPGGCSNVLAERALLLEVDGFDTSLSTAADYDLWIRLAARSPLAVDEQVRVGYVKHDDNMTLDVELSLRERRLVHDKHAQTRLHHGVQVDRVNWTRWVAVEARRGNRRAAAALLYLRLAIMPGVTRKERVRCLRWVARLLLRRPGPAPKAAPPVVTEPWAVAARVWLAPQLLPARTGVPGAA